MQRMLTNALLNFVVVALTLGATSLQAQNTQEPTSNQIVITTYSADPEPVVTQTFINDASATSLAPASPQASYAPVNPADKLSGPQLQSLVASIALYPDALLAQVLMASTYPLEVATAASWLSQNHLTGDALEAALSQQQWDNSVKSLVQFPDALKLMGNQLEWTRKLGDVYLAQPAELMQAVQALRAQAQRTGNLTSGQQILVSRDTQTNIVIVPTNPQIIYVPTYNPWFVYGGWPYMAYPPYPIFNPGWGAIVFGAGFGVGYALWATPYWGRGGVYINNAYYNRFNNRYNIPAYRYPARVGAHSVWAFSPEHRRNVPYGAPGVSHRYGATPAQQERLNQSRQAAQNTFHQNTSVPNASRARPAAASNQHQHVTPQQHSATTTRTELRPAQGQTHSPAAGQRSAGHSGRGEHR